MQFRKEWLRLGLAILVVIVPVILHQHSRGSVKEVEVQAITPRSIEPTVLASGVINYRTQVALTSEVVGKVTEINVAEGQDVQKGQVVLKLDPNTDLHAIERSEANIRQQASIVEGQKVSLEQKKITLARTSKLFKAGMSDQSHFDADTNAVRLAEADLGAGNAALNAARASLKDAHDQFNKTSVRSPISGRIVALPIKIGETAIPSTLSLAGAQLMTIADTSSVQAELEVDEGDVGRLKPGLPVDIFPAAWPDRAIKGKVIEIALASTIQSQGRAYKVIVHMKDVDVALRAGMSCRAEIHLGDGKKHVAVPVESILVNEDSASHNEARDRPIHSVWVVRDGLAQKIEIKLGISDDRLQEIEGNIKDGDQVIVGPIHALYELTEGEPVKQASHDQDRKKQDRSK